MTRHLLSIDDLDDDTVGSLMERATSSAAGQRPQSDPRVVGLLFLQTSLRTRVGFSAAAHRLGWGPVEVTERRSSEVSTIESLADTIRVVADYVDVLVTRQARPAGELAAWVPDSCALLNAGDGGPEAEHPTQALADLFAMEHLLGATDDLHVALTGDLRMRSARSLIRLLSRRRVGKVSLVTSPGLRDGLRLPPVAAAWDVHDDVSALEEVDALHAVGIPHGATDEGTRARLRVDRRSLDALTFRGRVFSPMPVIDEVAATVRDDPRVAFLEQSRLALHVRTAVLEHLVDLR